MSVPPVKSNRATSPHVTAATERAKRRYLRLVDELGAEEGAPAHGWVTAVARRLGITQGYLSRIQRRQRDAGPEAVDKAIARLRIRRAYFYDEREPTTYKEYLGKEPVFAGWREFLESPAGEDLTKEERLALASFLVPDGGEPSASFYEGVLHVMRKRITWPEFARGLAKADEISARLKRKRDAPAPQKGGAEDDAED
jgi:transcriptional regulator with XRE-family HTH domain